jgi:hypothetical protein
MKHISRALLQPRLLAFHQLGSSRLRASATSASQTRHGLVPETLIDEQPIMKNALSCWIAGVVLASVSGCAPLSQMSAAPRVREGSFSIPTSPPPANYDTAKIALKKLFASAPQTLSKAGRPRAFLHDQATEDVFVLLQGLTNAPSNSTSSGESFSSAAIILSFH